MPIYEYRCSACGSQQEVLQKMSEAPLTDCPECGKPTLTKMVSAAGFQLKGSGWYATDFKNSSKPKADTKSKGDETKGEAKTSGADEKSAAKTGDSSAGDKSSTKTEPTKPATSSAS
jgi:putative FmdB family regulatory protein